MWRGRPPGAGETPGVGALGGIDDDLQVIEVDSHRMARMQMDLMKLQVMKSKNDVTKNLQESGQVARRWNRRVGAGPNLFSDLL